MLLAFFPTSKVTKEAEILQEDFSLILSYQKKLLPDSNKKISSEVNVPHPDGRKFGEKSDEEGY